MDVVLVRPEIATNTGNIIRLCANTGVRLHLVEPLGFVMEDRLLRRAGLDYHELAEVVTHPSVESCRSSLGGGRRRFGFSSRATRSYDEIEFSASDVFVFGAERAGFDSNDVATLQPIELLRLPMRPNNRSLNLANSVAIVVYEAWRQQNFNGAAPPGVSNGGLTAEATSAAPFDN